MSRIKKISLIIFLAVITYGIAGLKSIAFCCGHCPVHESFVAQVEKPAACCSEKEKHDCCEHDSKDTPCQVIVLKYDWDFTHTGWIQLVPSSAVVDALFPVYSFFVPDIRLISRKISGFSPPSLLTSSKNYLFLIRTLLI